MSLLEWLDNFETGIRDIDQDHKELFSLMNTFYAALDSKTIKINWLKY